MDEKYSDVVKLFNNIRSLRAFAREQPIEVMREMADRFTEIMIEREAQAAEEEKELKQYLAKIEKARKALSDLGVNAEDLLSGNTEIKANRAPRKKNEPKYQITDENGELILWNGQGRKPKAIDIALKAGKALEDLLIKKGE